MRPSCVQCNRPAYYETPGGALCIDCQQKVVETVRTQNAMLGGLMNELLGMTEATVGLPGLFPRYEVPQPIVSKGPMTFNNIHVTKSIVGAINTGQMKQLDIAMDNVRAAGGGDLVEAASRFSEAALEAPGLTDEQKNDLVEQLTFAVNEALQPKAKRRLGMVKASLAALRETAATVSAVAGAWDKLAPLLHRVLGLPITVPT